MMLRLSIVLLAALVLPATAAEVQLRGVRPEVAKALLGALEGRLVYVKARPATPSRADDAAFLLEELLKKRGFTNPTVTWSIPSASTIVLSVEEGPQSSLGTVTVRGVEEPLATELREQFKAAHVHQTRIGGEDVPYLEGNNPEGVRRVEDDLYSRGYWDAWVKDLTTTRDASRRATDIVLEVHRGPLFRLLVPQVEAPGELPEDIRNALASLSGLPSTTANVNRAQQTLERYYRRQGYQFATVDMFTEGIGDRTGLTLTVDPGRRYRVGDVRITGTGDVDPERIAKRFRKFPGEPYNAAQAGEEIRDLLDTGAFQSIRLEEFPDPATGLLDLTLHISEGKPDGYHVYAGLGSYEGPFLGGGYYHRNAFNRLLSFNAGLEVSAIGLLGEVSLSDPWFLGTDLRFTTRGFILARQFEGYNKLEAGAGVELEWDINRFYSVAAYFNSSFVTLSADGITPSSIGPDNYFLNVLGLRQTYDRRNDKTLPTNGWFAQLETDLGLALGNNSVSFFRTEGQLSIYQPVITETSHVAVGARAGVIIPSSPGDGLPIDLRFFNGGANTVRSYRERQLGPTAPSGDPRGGQSYWIANAEYIHSIKSIASGVVFFDAGTLSRGHGDLFSGTPHYAAGLGLRLDLPIGPVRLEYGHNLSPEEGGPSGTWHFAIGTTF